MSNKAPGKATTPRPGHATTMAGASDNQRSTQNVEPVTTKLPIIPTLTGRPVTPVEVTTPKANATVRTTQHGMTKPPHTECSGVTEIISMGTEASKGML